MPYIQSRINDRVKSDEYLILKSIKELGLRYENTWTLIFDEENELGLVFEIKLINKVVTIIVDDQEFESIRVSSIWDDDSSPVENANNVASVLAGILDNLIFSYT